MLLLQRGFHILAHCPLPGIPISQVQEKYGAPLLLEALESFFATNVALQHHHRAHTFNRLNVYKYMTILSPPKQHMSNTKWFFKLHATPSCPASHNSCKGPSPAVFDSALFFKQLDPNTMRFESKGNPSSFISKSLHSGQFWTEPHRAHSLVHSGQLCPDTLSLWVSVQLCPDRHSCELLSKIVLIAHYLDCSPTIIDLIT